MNENPSDRCMCGHVYALHNDPYIKDVNLKFDVSFIYCTECRFDGRYSSGHKFQLDNLQFIEDLAKQKGLV